MKRKIIWSVVLLVLAVGGFVAYNLFRPAVANKQNSYFYIPAGESLASVKERLWYLNHINSDNDIDLACIILRFKKPKPGRYKIKDGMSRYRLVKCCAVATRSMKLPL
jgi:cell division protein YceG involved in septum cleavage